MSEQVAEKSAEIFNIYFCNPPSMQVIDSKGKPMVFISGRFHTKDEGQIAQLEDMVANGSGNIFKDPNMLTLAGDMLDPMAVLKEKFRQEFLAEQAAHLDPNNNPGESVQGKLNAASTSDIAAVAIGGPGSIASRINLGAAAAK